MPRKKRPEPFSEEANRLVLERISRLTAEELREMIDWRPEGVPDDWPTLVEPPPGAATPSLNGSASPPRRK